MCYKPFCKKSTGEYFPCGKCPKCRKRRVSSWSFRLMQEEKVSTSAHFITLTYDTRHVPITSVGTLSLRKKDLTNFFKRLRKAHPPLEESPTARSVKYYAVGEYGGKTERPHYHVILFNAEVELIQPAWDLGHVYYGSVSPASVGYTLKYIQKNRKQAVGVAATDPRIREYAVMSKGLGISYLSESNANWHVDALYERMYCTLLNGVKIAMPRYYKEKLYLDIERRALTEFYQVQATALYNKKLDQQTPKSVKAEMAAIDAAYDRMYLSLFKSKL